jgi:hypothetical protein
MQLEMRRLIQVDRYLNELDPFEQSHGLSELELDLNCALISLSRKSRPMRGEVGTPIKNQKPENFIPVSALYAQIERQITLNTPAKRLSESR